MPGLLDSVVWTAQTLDFCPFLPLTWSEAGRQVAQGAAIGCLQPDQYLGTRPVIGQPPGTVISFCGRGLLRPWTQHRYNLNSIPLPSRPRRQPSPIIRVHRPGASTRPLCLRAAAKSEHNSVQAPGASPAVEAAAQRIPDLGSCAQAFPLRGTSLRESEPFGAGAKGLTWYTQSRSCVHCRCVGVSPCAH